MAALWGCVATLRGWRRDAPADARALHLERTAERALGLFSAACGLACGSVALTVLAADELAPSLRGAACAYGVLSAAPGGMDALAVSGVALALASGWWRLRRVDARLPRGSLVRLLAALALPVGAALLLDAWLSLRALSGLDLGVRASCCAVAPVASSGLLEAPVTSLGALQVLARESALGGAALVAAGALTLEVTALRAWSLGVVSLAAVGPSLRALTDLAAPWVLGRPEHRCAFCLLRAEASPAGPVVLLGLALALSSGLGALWVAPVLRRGSLAREAARRELHALARSAGLGWVLAALGLLGARLAG
ncbi:MAG: hypothetical protein HY909_26705 [Deltaproteobacteria bacterium]|nr:hypothetical protein [Deltaproteobacteria bacterium]